jgi:MFS family permease
MHFIRSAALRPEQAGNQRLFVLKREWYVVAILWGAFALNYFDRQVVFSIFPVLRWELHFTSAELGSIGAIFTWVYSLAMPVSGRISDLVRRDRLIVLSIVLWSIATFGTGIAHSFGAFLFWRAMMGLSESLFMPAALGTIAVLHPGSTRSRALSLFATGQFAGIIGGGAFGGWTADHLGWRAGFWLLALAGIGYALIAGARGRLATPSKPEQHNSSWREAFRSRTWLILCCAFFFYCALLWMQLAWLADFIHSRYRLSLSESGVFATVFVQAGSAAGVLLGGYLGDLSAKRVAGGRFYVAALGLLLCAPFAWGLLAVHSLNTLKLFSFAFGMLGGLFVANVYASAYDVTSSKNYGFAAGAMNLVGGLAGGGAVLLSGVLQQRLGIGWLAGWIAAGASLSAIALVAAKAVWFQSDRARFILCGDQTGLAN